MPEDDPTRNRRENKGADPASCKTLQGPRAFKPPTSRNTRAQTKIEKESERDETFKTLPPPRTPARSASPEIGDTAPSSSSRLFF